jgi:hypothetical protein
MSQYYPCAQDKELAAAFIKMVELRANWDSDSPVVKINGLECAEPYEVTRLCMWAKRQSFGTNPKALCTGCETGVPNRHFWHAR